MPRIFEYNDKQYEFPDNIGDDEALKFIGDYNAPPPWLDVVASIPGGAKRQRAKAVAGVVKAAGDLFDVPEWSQEASAVNREIAAEAQAETPRNMTIPQEGVMTGGVSGINMLPTLALGAAALPLTGAATPAAATLALGRVATSVMGAETGLQKYLDVRDAGFSPLRSGIHGIIEGLIEKYTEYLPIREIQVGGPVFRELAKYLVREGLGEELATVGQFINAKASDRPDATLGDLAREMAVTAVATPVGGAVQFGGVQAGQALASPFLRGGQPTAGPEVPPGVTSPPPDAAPVPMPPTLSPEQPGGTAPPVSSLQTGLVSEASEASVANASPVPPSVAELLSERVQPLTAGEQTTEATPAETRELYGVVAPGQEAQSIRVSEDVEAMTALAASTNGQLVSIRGSLAQLIDAQNQVPEVERVADKTSGEFAVPLERVVPVAHPSPEAQQATAERAAQKTVGKEKQRVEPQAELPVQTETLPNGREITNQVSSYGSGGRTVTVTFPDTAHHRLQYLGKLIRERRGSKTDKRKAKLSVEIDALTSELSNRLGLRAAEVPQVAESYWLAYKDAEKLAWKQNGQSTIGDVWTTLKIARGSAQVATDLPAETVSKPYVATESEVTPGKTFVAPELRKSPYVLRMAKFIDAWMHTFAPKMRVAIEDVAVGHIHGSTLYENGVHHLWLGSPWQIETNVYSKTKELKLILDLAHEFGHMLIEEYIDQPRFAAAKAQVWADHQALLARVPNMTVGEFLRDWRGPSMTLAMREFGQLWGLREADPAMALVAKVDELMHEPGYMLGFHEYAAEQMSRYVNAHQKISFPESVRAMWQEVTSKVKEFYDRVVRKLDAGKGFTKFVDEMRLLAKLGDELKSDPIVVDAAQRRAQVDAGVEDLDKSYQYGLKVLDRLPRKPTVKKATVLSELARSDVRGQERLVFEEVLHDMPDNIDRGLLEQEVLGRLVPLSLQVLPSTRFNTYGYGNVDLPFVPGVPTAENNTRFSNTTPLWRSTKQGIIDAGGAVPEVHIWQVPFDTGPNTHFVEAERYYAHTRVIDTDTVHQVMEVQSDKVQRASRELTPEERQTLVDEIKLRSEYRDALRSWATDLRTAGVVAHVAEHLAPPAVAAAGKALGLRIPVAVSLKKDAWSLEQINWVVADQDLFMAEALKKLAESTDLSELPKRWYELVLRHELSEAARNGQDTMRVVGLNTLERIEGWGRSLPNDQLPPNAQAIYDFYRRDVLPFVSKELGGKQVVDEYGQEWWDVPVDPAMRDKPIRYFAISQDQAAASDAVASAVGEPSIGRGFARVQDFLQVALQTNQLSKMLPDVEGLMRYRRAMQDMHNLKNTLMEQPNAQLEMWHSVRVKQAELTEDALRAEVKEGVHWTQLEQAEAVDELGNTEMVWVHRPTERFQDELRARGMDTRAGLLMLGVKNDFLRILGVMEKTLRRQMQRAFASSPVLLDIRLRELAKEFDTLRRTPYLPDARFGNYVVQVRAGHDESVDGREIKAGELVYQAHFESESERDEHFEKLKREYGEAHKVSQFYIDDTASQLAGLPSGFVNMIVETLNAQPETALTPEQMQVIENVRYDYSKAGKFEKYLKAGKKGVGGASLDVRRAFANYVWKTANAISKMEYGDKLRDSIGLVRAEALQEQQIGRNPTPLLKLEAHLKKNLDYVMHPQNEWQALRGFVSLWYLIGSPKTALANFTSVPILTYSHLAAQYGDGAAVASIVRATKTVAQFFRDPMKVPANVRRALAMAKADGVTNQSYATMLANVAEGGVALEKMIPKYGFLKNRKYSDAARKASWKIVSMGMAPFRAVEQLNRMITLVATYNLESERLGAKDFSQDAYTHARDAVDYTQNDFNAWNKPQFLQGKASVFLIFYSFVQNLSFMLFGGDKGWWRAMLVLLAMAGLQGLPGAQNLLDMLNWTGRKMTGQNVDLGKEAREVAEIIGLNPDMVMHGLSHNLLGLGLDVSNSIGMGRIIPGTDAIFGVGKFEHRFLQAANDVGGPFGSLTISFLQALADDNGDALQRFDRTLPPAIRNVARAWKGYEQGAWESLRGQPLVLDPTAAEIIGQALGFGPTRKLDIQERMRVERDAAQYYQIRRTALMAAAYQARKSGELDAWEDVRERIDDFNAGVPVPQLRIQPKDITASMKVRDRSEREALENRSPQKRYQALYDAISPYYATNQ